MIPAALAFLAALAAPTPAPEQAQAPEPSRYAAVALETFRKACLETQSSEEAARVAQDLGWAGFSRAAMQDKPETLAFAMRDIPPEGEVTVTVSDKTRIVKMGGARVRSRHCGVVAAKLNLEQVLAELEGHPALKGQARRERRSGRQVVSWAYRLDGVRDSGPFEQILKRAPAGAELARIVVEHPRTILSATYVTKVE